MYHSIINETQHQNTVLMRLSSCCFDTDFCLSCVFFFCPSLTVEDKGGLPKKPLSSSERQGAGEAKRRKRSCEDLSQKPHSDSPLSAAPASTSLLEAPASASSVPGQSSSSAPASASSVPGQSSSSAPASASSVPTLGSSSAPVSASSVPALASSSAPVSASSVPALSSSSGPVSASSVPALASSDVQPRRSSGGSTHSDPAHSEVTVKVLCGC
nr:endochitinase A1-like [Danio rerio]|eukprot:XP_021331256.1 endochitinase A1-like [Danio rerio]